MSTRAGYVLATRHPWPCLLFLLPLLLIYECGVVWLGGTQPEALRNGADHWLRWNDRPGDLFGLWLGMAIESVLFALGLWALSRALGPLLDELGIELNQSPRLTHAVGQIVTFIGAGIYEETLFRLMLFAGLAWLLRRLVGLLLATLLAALASAALFSAAHHIGPFGEPFNAYVFLFRALAGLYFAGLLQLRGFGIAVGAHACYDVLVGASVG